MGRAKVNPAPMPLHVVVVPTFVIGWSLAAVLGGGSLIWLLWRGGVPLKRAVLVFAACVVTVLVGSKVLYLIETWPAWLANRAELHAALFSERMRIPGGLFLSIAIGPFLARRIAVRYLWFADTTIPPAGLCIVGARVGCFLEGCCYGTPSSLPWATRFPASTDAYRWQLEHGLIAIGADATTPIHPLQAYFGAAGLLIFVGLVLYMPYKRYDGEVLLLFALSYLWSTWLLELLRALPHDFTRQAVLAGAIATTVSGTVVELRFRDRRRRVVTPLGPKPNPITP